MDRVLYEFLCHVFVSVFDANGALTNTLMRETVFLHCEPYTNRSQYIYL